MFDGSGHPLAFLSYLLKWLPLFPFLAGVTYTRIVRTALQNISQPPGTTLSVKVSCQGSNCIYLFSSLKTKKQKTCLLEV